MIPAERHESEQYFFDRKTTAELADLADAHQNPCCLCTPLVARELYFRGRIVRLLDSDERFAGLPGYLPFDLHRPRWLGETYDLILCDPPFFSVSLERLFNAVRRLANFDFSQRLVVSYPVRREQALLDAFAPFALKPTGRRPSYASVANEGRNDIQLYATFPLAD